jgi:galactokinase
MYSLIYSGAGWGGCTVSLVAEGDVESFIEKVKNAYPPFKNLEGERLNEVIFATKPSSGACGALFLPCLCGLIIDFGL